MYYLLHFSGPSSFEQTVTLKPGGEAVVVGRDPEAAVYLPDTERLVSRRHVSIEWSDNGARVKVLSANGINTDQGDYFAGDEVVLADGESSRIGSFTFIVSGQQASVDLDATSFAGMGTRPVPSGPVTRAAPAGGGEGDDLADLATEWAPVGQQAGAERDQGLPERQDGSSNFEMDDPFSSSTSWRLSGDESFGSKPAGSAAAAADDPFAALAGEFAAPGAGTAPTPAPVAAPAPVRTLAQSPAASGPSPEKFALQSLCRGLGVEAPQVLTSFDWERLGASMRHVIQCLSDHMVVRQEFRKETKAEDRTMMGGKEVNPLKSAMPVKDLVQYLLFMPDGAGGFVPANRGLQEVAQEARWHEAATRAAAHVLAEGALKDFEPAKLRGVLLKGKLSIGSVVDNARLWDLYSAHYSQKGEKVSEWAGQLFNRYYMAAYLRETERLRRAAMPKAPDRES